MVSDRYSRPRFGDSELFNPTNRVPKEPDPALDSSPAFRAYCIEPLSRPRLQSPTKFLSWARTESAVQGASAAASSSEGVAVLSAFWLARLAVAVSVPFLLLTLSVVVGGLFGLLLVFLCIATKGGAGASGISMHSFGQDFGQE